MNKDSRKNFEAIRYRQQVMLHEIVAQSLREERPDAEAHAHRILGKISKIEWTKNSTASLAALDGYEKEISLVGASVNIVYSNKQSHPQWLRFLAIGLPAFLILFFGFLILERRRRLKDLSSAEVESFEATDADK